MRTYSCTRSAARLLHSVTTLRSAAERTAYGTVQGVHLQQHSDRLLMLIKREPIFPSLPSQTITRIEETVLEAYFVDIRTCMHTSACYLTLTQRFKQSDDSEQGFMIRLDKSDSEDGKDAGDLIQQLATVPTGARKIRIESDAPSDEEWEILGQHLSGVTDLGLNSGFHETLSENMIPTHWPLERLLIISATAEVVQNPLILEGRVKHLTLLLTHELRFTGPTTLQLVDSFKEAVAKGDAQYEKIGKSDLKLISVPKLAAKWMKENMGGKVEFSLEKLPPSSSKLQRLDILENNALETFVRMAFAIPTVMLNLKHLVLRSTGGADFVAVHESMFSKLLLRLTGIEELRLVIGDVFEDEDIISTLYEHLPPNLVNFQFRGPVRIARNEHWPKWVEAFADPAFLPRLQKVSFVLDRDYHEVEGRKKKTKASDEDLRGAQKACQGLLQVLESRNVIAEPFYEYWVDGEGICFDDVDPRWYS